MPMTEYDFKQATNFVRDYLISHCEINIPDEIISTILELVDEAYDKLDYNEIDILDEDDDAELKEINDISKYIRSKFNESIIDDETIKNIVIANNEYEYTLL